MTFIKGEPRPPNAGRKKGSRNKRTVALAEASHEAIRSGSTPLDFLLQVLRDPAKDDRLRLDAAKAAAPYCHQRLTVAEDANRTQWDDPEKSSDQIRADLDRLLAEMGVPEAIRKAVLWGDKACPGRRTRHGPPGEAAGYRTISDLIRCTVPVPTRKRVAILCMPSLPLASAARMCEAQQSYADRSAVELNFARKLSRVGVRESQCATREQPAARRNRLPAKCRAPLFERGC
jgi:hypothetical protein